MLLETPKGYTSTHMKIYLYIYPSAEQIRDELILEYASNFIETSKLHSTIVQTNKTHKTLHVWINSHRKLNQYKIIRFIDWTYGQIQFNNDCQSQDIELKGFQSFLDSQTITHTHTYTHQTHTVKHSHTRIFNRNIFESISHIACSSQADHIIWSLHRENGPYH